MFKSSAEEICGEFERVPFHTYNPHLSCEPLSANVLTI